MAPSSVRELVSHDVNTTECVSDSDADGNGSAEVIPPRLQGHFEVRLNVRLISTDWRVGKGSSRIPKDRNVDILLLAPKEMRSQSTERNALTIAPEHFFIRMSPESGALVLILGKRNRPLRYLDANGLPLRNDASHVLYHR